MNDALGNELVIGGTYGYSTKDSVVIGVLKSIGQDKVTLDVSKRRDFIYAEETTKHWRGVSGKASIRSFHLFPVKA